VNSPDLGKTILTCRPPSPARVRASRHRETPKVALSPRSPGTQAHVAGAQAKPAQEEDGVVGRGSHRRRDRRDRQMAAIDAGGRESFFTALSAGRDRRRRQSGRADGNARPSTSASKGKGRRTAWQADGPPRASTSDAPTPTRKWRWTEKTIAFVKAFQGPLPRLRPIRPRLTTDQLLKESIEKAGSADADKLGLDPSSSSRAPSARANLEFTKTHCPVWASARQRAFAVQCRTAEEVPFGRNR